MTQVQVCSTPFAVVPEWLVNHDDITLPALRVYVKLAGYGNAVAGGYCSIWPKQQTLANDLGVSKTTVERAIRVLKEAGVLRVEQRRRGSAKYRLVTDQPGENPVDNDKGRHRVTDLESSQGDGSDLDPVDQEQHLSLASLARGIGDATPDPLDGFDEFWAAYPRRKGKRRERAKAEAQWKTMGPTQRTNAQAAVGHYADSGEGPADAFRWLRDGKNAKDEQGVRVPFADWLTPATRDGPRQAVTTFEPGWADDIDEAEGEPA